MEFWHEQHLGSHPLGSKLLLLWLSLPAESWVIQLPLFVAAVDEPAVKVDPDEGIVLVPSSTRRR